MDNYTLIHNAHLIDANTDTFGSLLIKNNKIHTIIPHKAENLPEIFEQLGDEILLNATKIDAKGLILTPAFVDMHVHFRYPGQSAKEDLESGSRAACHGGMGTVILMPNTSPIVSSPELASEIRAQTEKIGFTDALQKGSPNRDCLYHFIHAPAHRWAQSRTWSVRRW